MKSRRVLLLLAALGALLVLNDAVRAETPPWWKGDRNTTTSGPSRGDESTAVRADEPVQSRPSFGGPFLEEYTIEGVSAESMEDRAKAAASTAVPATAADVPVSADARYNVQPGDLLQVSVWREPDLTREVRVSPDGWITYPLVGEMKVEGQTVDTVRAELETKLGRFVNQAVVDVSVKEPDGNRVYVLGKVNRPGAYPFSKSIDVVQALTLAGGTSKFASIDDIKILRRIGAEQRAFKFNYSDVERGRHLEQNIALMSGDVVLVP